MSKKNDQTIAHFAVSMRTFVRAGSTITFRQSNKAHNRPNFDTEFVEITIHGNTYYCTLETKGVIQSLQKADKKYPKMSYNLTYFPLIDGFVRLNDALQTCGTIENTKPMLLPLVVNINNTWYHPCAGAGNEEAGAYNCAEPIGGRALIYQKYLAASPFPAGHEGVQLSGDCYFIPLLASNMSTIYLATSEKEAVELYLTQLEAVKNTTTKRFFIGVDALPIAVDGWDTQVSVFGIIEKDGEKILNGVKFVSVV